MNILQLIPSPQEFQQALPALSWAGGAAMVFMAGAFVFSGRAPLSRLCAGLVSGGALVATWMHIKGFSFPPKDMIACLAYASGLIALSVMPAQGWRMTFPLAAVVSVVGGSYLLGAKDPPLLAGALVLALSLPSVMVMEKSLELGAVGSVLSFALAVFPGARVLEWSGSFSLAQMAASFNTLVPAFAIMAFVPSLREALTRAMAVAAVLWILLMMGAWNSLGASVKGPLALIALSPCMMAVTLIPAARGMAWARPLLTAGASVGAAYWCHHITGGSAY